MQVLCESEDIERPAVRSVELTGEPEQPATINELYSKLKPGKKSKLLREYMDMVGSRATFFRRVGKDPGKLRKIEQLFFMKYLQV